MNEYNWTRMLKTAELNGFSLERREDYAGQEEFFIWITKDTYDDSLGAISYKFQTLCEVRAFVQGFRFGAYKAPKNFGMI